jgi:hypothetical protein
MLRASTRNSDLKQRVEQFGVGADLKIRLANGDKIRGAVESVGSDAFVLTPKGDNAPLEIAYADLQAVSYPPRGYKTEGTPDAAAAKRVVVKFGVGEHILVKTNPDQALHGYIRGIEDDHFIFQPDGKAAVQQIAYSEVHKVHKNLSFGATIAIIAGIAAAVALILVLSDEDDVDVLPD